MLKDLDSLEVHHTISHLTTQKTLEWNHPERKTQLDWTLQLDRKGKLDIIPGGPLERLLPDWTGYFFTIWESWGLKEEIN